MKPNLIGNLLYWTVILFFGYYILTRFFGTDEPDVIIMLIYISGILLVSIGSKLTVKPGAVRSSVRIAIQKAKENSSFWWLPFLGMVVMNGAAVATFYFGLFSVLFRIFSLFLAIIISILTIERLNSE